MLSEKASCFLSNLILSFWSSNTKNYKKRCKQDKMSLFVFSVFVKGIAQPKMWADLEKFSFVSLAQQWIHCSKWVPSEWVQTADKTSQSSISNRLHHLTSCEAKSCVFVRNKSIIKTFGLQTLFQLKYESSHLYCFIQWNVVSSESGRKYAQIRHRLQAKTGSNSSKQIFRLILIFKGQQEMDFFTEGSIIMDYALIMMNNHRVFSLHKVLILRTGVV